MLHVGEHASTGCTKELSSIIYNKVVVRLVHSSTLASAASAARAQYTLFNYVLLSHVKLSRMNRRGLFLYPLTYSEYLKLAIQYLYILDCLVIHEIIQNPDLLSI